MLNRTSPLLLLAAVVLACGGAEPTPSPSPSPTEAPSGPLVTLESRGGHCMDGPCGKTLVLNFDGTVHEAAKPPNDLGVVEPALVDAMIQAIAEADFAEIRSHPFTGECPVNFDGTELVVEFTTATGTERIEGCQVEVDWDSPLFATVTAVLDPWLE